MRRFFFAKFSLLLITACQTATTELTEEQRTEIAAEVRQVFEDEIAAANAGNPELDGSSYSEQDGICIYGTTMLLCSEALEEARRAHNQDNEFVLDRQEQDGEEIRVVVLNPTVAIVASTVEENRAYFTNGAVYRSRFASLYVYVNENGDWKTHSSQDAFWPVEDENDNQN